MRAVNAPQTVRAAIIVADRLCQEAGLSGSGQVAVLALRRGPRFDAMTLRRELTGAQVGPFYRSAARRYRADSAFARVTDDVTRRLVTRPRKRTAARQAVAPSIAPDTIAAVVSLTAYRGQSTVLNLLSRRHAPTYRPVRAAAAHILRTHCQLTWPAIADALYTCPGSAAGLVATARTLLIEDAGFGRLVAQIIGDLTAELAA